MPEQTFQLSSIKIQYISLTIAWMTSQLEVFRETEITIIYIQASSDDEIFDDCVLPARACAASLRSTLLGKPPGASWTLSTPCLVSEAYSRIYSYTTTSSKTIGCLVLWSDCVDKECCHSYQISEAPAVSELPSVESVSRFYFLGRGWVPGDITNYSWCIFKIYSFNYCEMG